jgi:peroxiredoxin
MEQIFLVSSFLLWIVVVFNLVLTLALIRRVGKLAEQPDFEDIPILDVGSKAPDFSAETLDGQSVNLATYAQKSVAFVFVSPTCAPCIDKISMLNRICPLARLNGVEMVLVCLADKNETHNFSEKHSVQLPVLSAPRDSNPFMENYKVAGTPAYCFVDGEGRVQSSGFLDTKWEQLVYEWSSGV